MNSAETGFGWMQVFSGFVMAILFLSLILGSLTLSLAENGYAVAFAPAMTGVAPATLTMQVYETLIFLNPESFPAQFTPRGRVMEPRAPLAVFSATPACPPRRGWERYIVQAGETLSLLAARFGVSEPVLMQESCLTVASLLPGTEINVPRRAPTRTVMTCGAPVWWVTYYVRSGDTLYRLAQAVGVSYTQIQFANCLRSTYIYTGQALRLPSYPVFTPYPTVFIPTVTRWPTVTASWTPAVIASPTSAPIASSTGTISLPTASDTPAGAVPSATTSSAAPSDTPVLPSDTPVPPSAMPVPPSATPIPPSATPIPPSATPIPPPPPEPPPPAQPSATPDPAPVNDPVSPSLSNGS